MLGIRVRNESSGRCSITVAMKEEDALDNAVVARGGGVMCRNASCGVSRGPSIWALPFIIEEATTSRGRAEGRARHSS